MYKYLENALIGIYSNLLTILTLLLFLEICTFAHKYIS